jgi:tetratricopeptide (TPR) repeat protein
VNIRFINIVILVFLFVPSHVLAETVILKSGRKMDGKIMQKTDKEIKINTGSILTSYRLDEVESIDGKKVELYTPGASAPEVNKDTDIVREALTRGIDYLERQMYEKSIAEFSKAIEINSGISDIYYNRGLAYTKAGKIDQAIADYTAAIKINPEDSDSYYNRGLAYHSKKDYDKAISDYTESIKLTPDIGATYYNRALDYSLKQEYDKAWEDVHKAESFGYVVSAYFITELQKASKRKE